jgi:hypothetical protein
MNNAKEAVAEKLEDNYLNLTKIDHLNYAATTVSAEGINGTRSYTSEHNVRKTPPWLTRKLESTNDVRKGLPTSAEVKRDELKTQNVKRKRLLRKYSTDLDNLEQMIEELRLSRHRKRHNQYCHSKMFRTDCKKVYSILRQKDTNVKQE